jgi:hypothetical protein
LGAAPAPEAVRGARAVRALEWAGSPAARRELERLAGGHWLAAEARAALERLGPAR